MEKDSSNHTPESMKRLRNAVHSTITKVIGNDGQYQEALTQVFILFVTCSRIKTSPYV